MDPNLELAKERHRNLTIWKEAMALVNDIYTTTKTFPKDEVWGSYVSDPSCGGVDRLKHCRRLEATR